MRGAAAALALAGLAFAALLAPMPGQGASAQTAQRVVPIGEQPVLTHAHACGYSEALSCYVARLSDGMIGPGLLPDPAARPGGRFAFEHGRISGGNEYVANGLLISRITRTGPGAYQLGHNFYAPGRSEWLEPLRRAEIFYSGRAAYGLVEGVRPRLERTGSAVLPAGARVAEAVFVGVPTQPVKGLIGAPATLTIDRPLDVRLDLGRVPGAATRGLAREFSLVLETHPAVLPGGAELQARQVRRIDGLTERSDVPVLSVARLPVGPYRLRVEGPDGVTLEARRLDLRLPNLAGALALEPVRKTYGWDAPPSAVLTLPGLPQALRNRLTVEIVRLSADGPERARVASASCGAAADPCLRRLALAVPGGALAPGRYAARLLVSAGQPGVPHTDYLAAEAPFTVEGDVPAGRLAAGDLPEAPFGAEFRLFRPGGKPFEGAFAPWQRLPLELLDRSGALERAGAFLAVLPLDGFTWSCQPLDRRIVGGIHPVTRLGPKHPRLSVAEPSGVLRAGQGAALTRGAEAAGGLRSPALIPPLPAGPTLPGLPAAPALPSDVLPATTEYRGPGSVPAQGALTMDGDIAYFVSDGAVPAPEWPRGNGVAALERSARLASPPAVAVLARDRAQPADTGQSKRVTLAVPGDPGRYQLVLFVGGRMIGGRDAIGNARAVARWPFEVAARDGEGIAPARQAVRWGYQSEIAARVAPPDLAGSAPLVAELWSKGDRTLGGAVVHPHRIAAAPVGRGSTGAALRVGLDAYDWRDAGLSSGAHEFRLTAAGVVLSRADVALQTIEPALQWPAEIAPRPVPDALAGDGGEPSDNILPPSSVCAPPEFRTPPVLRAVIWRGGDPESLDDDVYEPTDGVFPGWPFFIEARFAPGEAADAVYVVTVEGVGGVRVYRTERDPLVFRSDMVTVQRAASAGEGEAP